MKVKVEEREYKISFRHEVKMGSSYVTVSSLPNEKKAKGSIFKRGRRTLCLISKKTDSGEWVEVGKGKSRLDSRDTYTKYEGRKKSLQNAFVCTDKDICRIPRNDRKAIWASLFPELVNKN